MILDNLLFNQLCSEAGLHYLGHHLEVTLSMNRSQYKLSVVLSDGESYVKHFNNRTDLTKSVLKVLDNMGDVHFNCPIPEVERRA